MKLKLFFILLLIFTFSSFSQVNFKKWAKYFYNSSELLVESSLENKNIIKKLKKSFTTSSLETKRILRLLEISPNDIQKITKRFNSVQLVEIIENLEGLSPRATQMFISDLARYTNSNRIENLIAVLKKDKRIFKSYERATSSGTGFLSAKFRTNVGVLLQIADGKSPIKIRTTVAQKHKSLYKKKLISSNGLVFEGYFPDFGEYTVFNMVLPKQLVKASDAEQMKHCSKQLRASIKKNPSFALKFNAGQLVAINSGKQKIPGYTWHHSESKVGGMDLVETKIHKEAVHDGGVAFWGGGFR